MLVAAHEQSVNARVSRRLDNLLGLGGCLADAEPRTETLERGVASRDLPLFDKRIAAPVQLFVGKGVGVRSVRPLGSRGKMDSPVEERGFELSVPLARISFDFRRAEGPSGRSEWSKGHPS
jgi:hypothetical protein